MAAVLVRPSEELLVEIRKSFREDVRTCDQELETIKEWLRKQPHLPDTWDERPLRNFLRGCNYSLEKCKRKLDMYFTMRAALPEFFTNRDVRLPELQEICNIGEFAVLPGLTPDGKRVSVAQGAHIDFETPDINNFVKIVFMLGDLRLKMEETGVTGDIYVLDASVAVSKHFLKVSPMAVKKFIVCVQEAYPVKVKEVHIINSTPLVSFIIKWMSPFLKEKIRNRIKVHDSLESLHKYVPPHMLPDEYGGAAGRLRDLMQQWVQTMEQYEPWFKEQESVKADESKRPGKPHSHEDLFGLDGSFKQLSID